MKKCGDPVANLLCIEQQVCWGHIAVRSQTSVCLGLQQVLGIDTNACTFQNNLTINERFIDAEDIARVSEPEDQRDKLRMERSTQQNTSVSWQMFHSLYSPPSALHRGKNIAIYKYVQRVNLRQIGVIGTEEHRQQGIKKQRARASTKEEHFTESNWKRSPKVRYSEGYLSDKSCSDVLQHGLHNNWALMSSPDKCYWHREPRFCVAPLQSSWWTRNFGNTSAATIYIVMPNNIWFLATVPQEAWVNDKAQNARALHTKQSKVHPQLWLLCCKRQNSRLLEEYPMQSDKER